MYYTDKKIFKEPWLAVNLSVLFAGIGQIYSKCVKRGLVLIFLQVLIASVGAWQMFSMNGNILIGVVCLLFYIIIYFWSLFDAYKCAKNINGEDFEKQRKETNDPWLSVFLTHIFPGLGHIYIRKWILAIIFFILWVVVILLEEIHYSFSIVGAFILALICYKAYNSSKIRRESSKRIILIFIITIFCFYSLHENLKGFLKGNVISIFKVPGASMSPTLQKGDVVFAKLSTSYIPKRSDVIVFKSPYNETLSFIKRVIAFGGETIEIKEGEIYINNIRLNTSQFNNIQYNSTVEFGPYLIPNDSLFVLGDNSLDSRDSRYFGAIKPTNVIGKVYKIMWPIKRMGFNTMR